jgi:hypothetical protein
MTHTRPDPVTRLHLTKLAVGISDVEHLRQIQARRLAEDPPLRHRTRNVPRRAAEVLAGGSMYWVVKGAMIVRQRILDIREESWEDGSACAGLLLDPALVPVEGRPVRAFQGWRYLTSDAAPADLDRPGSFPGETDLPPQLRQELRGLVENGLHR